MDYSRCAMESWIFLNAKLKFYDFREFLNFRNGLAANSKFILSIEDDHDGCALRGLVAWFLLIGCRTVHQQMNVSLFALWLCALIFASGVWATSLGYCRKTSLSVPSANSFASSSFDPPTKNLFFSTDTSSQTLIYKLNSNSFTSPATTTLSVNDVGIYVTLNDATRGAVYFAGGYPGRPQIVSRVFAGNWTEWSTTTTPGGDVILSGVIDEAAGFVYFGTTLGSVLKFAVSTFSVVAQIDDLGLALRCAIIDPTGIYSIHHLYFYTCNFIPNLLQNTIMSIKISTTNSWWVYTSRKDFYSTKISIDLPLPRLRKFEFLSKCGVLLRSGILRICFGCRRRRFDSCRASFIQWYRHVV